MRVGLAKARDWSLELTAAVPGTLLWNEMKENARLASVDADEMERARPGWEKKAGGMHIIANTVRDAFKGRPSERRKWELHVVGHSAGAIFAAHAMELFCGVGVDFKSFQLLAPAITVDLFKNTVMKLAKDGTCPVPELDILSDEAERNDEVGPYCKSLFYLVSHAFEGARPTPLLGMQKYVAECDGMLDDLTDPDVVDFLRGHVVIANDESGKKYRCSRSDTHGGFDNDPGTLSSVLFHILGKEPVREFTKRDLQYLAGGRSLVQCQHGWLS